MSESRIYLPPPESMIDIFDDEPTSLKDPSKSSNQCGPQVPQGSDDSALPQTEFHTQTCKLLVTQQRFALLYNLAGIDDDGSGMIHLESQIPTTLQVLQTNTAENIAAAVYASLTKSWNTLGCKSFTRVLDVVTTDNYSANGAAETLLTKQDETEHPHVAQLSGYCINSLTHQNLTTDDQLTSAMPKLSFLICVNEPSAFPWPMG